MTQFPLFFPDALHYKTNFNELPLSSLLQSKHISITACTCPSQRPREPWAAGSWRGQGGRWHSGQHASQGQSTEIKIRRHTAFASALADVEPRSLLPVFHVSFDRLDLPHLPEPTHLAPSPGRGHGGYVNVLSEGSGTFWKELFSPLSYIVQ